MNGRPAAGVVVITGSSSGIGQATAEAFASRGATLVLAARNLEALEEVARRCRAAGAADVLVHVTDVTDAAAVRELAKTAIGFGRRIDVWVSNVGIGAVGRYEETPVEAHARVIQANLIGHMNDAHAVIPIFRRQRAGIFINMISLGGFAAVPFAAAYSASKFGLRGFAEALRAEVADMPGIRICDVYPAFVDTPGLRHGANYVGRRLSAPPPVLDARAVARAIVRLADHPRPSTSVGVVTDLVRVGHALAPNLGARLLARFMTSYFRRAPRTAIKDGALYAAAPIPGGIDGGLRSTAAGPGVRGFVLVAAIAAGLAATVRIAAAQRRSRHRRWPL